MDYLSEFFALWLLNFFNLISPGPETVVMIRNSSIFSRKIGFYTGLGILTSTTIHKTYSLLGFGMFIAKNTVLFTTFKLLASLYLCYLGYQALMFPKKLSTTAANKKTLTAKAAFKMGFTMDIVHPGASLVFITLVATTISPDTPFSIQAIYGICLLLTSFIWYTLLSFVFSGERLQKILLRFGPSVERITGCALISFGCRIWLLTPLPIS